MMKLTLIVGPTAIYRLWRGAVSHRILLPGVLVVGFSLSGCAAATIALEKKDLKVETQMSATIFLDEESDPEKTIFVSIKNTSDKDIDIVLLVTQHLQSKGYKIKSSAKDAYYIAQCNILYVGRADPSAVRQTLLGGYGSALGGAAAGAGIGALASGNTSGAAIGLGVGAIVAGVAELVTGALVKDVTFTIVTDLMITERIARKTKESRKYLTRVVSTANQVNLKFEDALAPLTQGLARSIAGIF